MYYLIILSLFLLNVSCEFIDGSLERATENHRNFVINTGYLIKTVTTKSYLSKIECAGECFMYAQGYSTVCAGVVANNGSCLVLFPDIGDVQARTKIDGVDLINHRTSYLYRPRRGKIIFVTITFVARINHTSNKDYTFFLGH